MAPLPVAQSEEKGELDDAGAEVVVVAVGGDESDRREGSDGSEDGEDVGGGEGNWSTCGGVEIGRGSENAI